MTDTLDSLIAEEAKDLLPETWVALRESSSFGPAALDRRYKRVVKRIFGVIPTNDEQEALDDKLIEYAGKKLAIALCDAGIDLWSVAPLSQAAGPESSDAYGRREEHLREMRKQWIAETAALYLDIEPLLPARPGRAVDAPRVVQAGETVPHVTNSIDDLEPLYGLPEDVTTTGA